MHPIIAEFPSRRFYEGKIEDAANILDLVGVDQCHWYSEPVFAPLVFFDVADGAHTISFNSFINELEAAMVEAIVRALLRCYPGERWKEKIAVVTPYAEQVRLIRDKLKGVFGSAKPCPVEVNTVDGFQGREKDCVIVSTVRAASKDDSIGFLRDGRRMNVTLTRARQNLWVVGNHETLGKNELWGDFLKFASGHGYVQVRGNPAGVFSNCQVYNPADAWDGDEKSRLEDVQVIIDAEPEEIQ